MEGLLMGLVGARATARARARARGGARSEGVGPRRSLATPPPGAIMLLLGHTASKQPAARAARQRHRTTTPHTTPTSNHNHTPAPLSARRVPRARNTRATRCVTEGTPRARARSAALSSSLLFCLFPRPRPFECSDPAVTPRHTSSPPPVTDPAVARELGGRALAHAARRGGGWMSSL